MSSPSGLRAVLSILLLTLGVGACATPQTPVPEPRTIIVYSGERLQADPEHMRDIEDWLRPLMDDWDRNPSYLLRLERTPEPFYPWDTLKLEGDTSTVFLQRGVVDAETPHYMYGHLRLMQERDEIGQWLPEVEEGELEGIDLEEAILARVSDVWFLGRSVYDTQAYGPLDELLYAKEAGLLREYILATQGERFSEALAAHTSAHPDWEGRLRAFFQRTFEREGPGYLRGDREFVPIPGG
jgi:hypothetical protein